MNFKTFLIPALIVATGSAALTANAMGERPTSTNPAVGQAPMQPQPGMNGPHGGPHNGKFGEKMFEKADANHDGQLTKAEILASMQKRVDKMFAEWDTNKDGMLSKEEAARGRDMMRQKMMQRWQQKQAQ